MINLLTKLGIHHNVSAELSCYWGSTAKRSFTTHILKRCTMAQKEQKQKKEVKKKPTKTKKEKKADKREKKASK